MPRTLTTGNSVTARAAALACALLCGAPAALGSETLRLATWNLEWLMTPATFERLARSCNPDTRRAQGRAIPCNIVEPPRSMQRSAADIARLRDYAHRLDADVVALQEVDGPAAAALVFPGYAFCFTQRDHVQNVGFAVRPGLPFECADYSALALDGDGLRRGAELTLFPGSTRPVYLLSVHLKSGCPSQLLTNRREDCRRLAEQVPVLEHWIDRRAAQGVAFAVLGDFNRRLARERHSARDRHGKLVAMWPELDDGDPAEADLTNVTSGQPYRPCVLGERYADFIDHIVLSHSLAAQLVPESFQQLTYEREDSRRGGLSDHCPIAVTLKMRDR